MLSEILWVKTKFRKFLKLPLNSKDELLVVPDGDYLLLGETERKPLNVRVKSNLIYIQPKDFDYSNALVI